MSNQQYNSNQQANKKINETAKNDEKRPANNGKPEKTGH